MNQPLVTKNTKDTRIRIRELTLAILCSVPFGGFFFMWAGWMLVTIPDRYQTEVDFRSRALLTSGTVTAKREQQTCYSSGGLVATSCTSSCDLKVKFTDNEGIVEFWDSCYKSANKNQAIPVLYDPTHVSKARIDRGDTPKSLATGQFISSMIAGLLGIVSLSDYSPTENNRKQT